MYVSKTTIEPAQYWLYNFDYITCNLSATTINSAVPKKNNPEGNAAIVLSGSSENKNKITAYIIGDSWTSKFSNF